MSVIPAIIKDNKPVCPYCERETKELKVVDVEVALVDNKKHFELEAKCLRCNRKTYYFLDLEMFKRKSISKNSKRFEKAEQ